MPTKPKTQKDKGVVDKRKTKPTKPDLQYWTSEGDPPRYVFIRLSDTSLGEDSLVALYRLLETFNIDTEKAMDRWRRIRAMKLPFWVLRKLSSRYKLVTLEEADWLGVD